jgi:dihydroorotate dehydrogenase electron transfer subunit
MDELKKYMLDLRVSSVEHPHERYVLVKLTQQEPLPAMMPGQFVEVRIDGPQGPLLRRPISVNFVDREHNELWLLVAVVGNGTRWLATLKAGDTVNVVGPLGRWFTPAGETAGTAAGETAGTATEGTAGTAAGGRWLLVGGGVGVAPLLFQGAALRAQGCEPVFLLGARTQKDLLLIDEFRRYGEVFVTTEDGSEGERGFVTQHSLLGRERFGMIQTCGPTPMMKAVARYAYSQGVECEVSLENMMACGLGACLCCVEKTTEGNLCVCKEGPVFNIKKLLWQF